jgi:hypothetical protein
MIGIRHLAAILILCLANPLFAQTDFPEYGYVTAETPLFLQPKAENVMSVRAPRGQRVRIVEGDGEWTRVVLLEVFISASQVDSALRAGADGGDLLFEPDRQSSTIGTVSPDTPLEGYFGEPYALVDSPASLSFWLPSAKVSVTGLPLRDSDLVAPDQLSIEPADFQKIKALEGLRTVILPTGILAGKPELVSADSGRFGPSYSVKYTFGEEWFSISCGTDGLGGPDLGQPLYQVHSDVLGKIVVGTMSYGQSKDLFMFNAPIRDGSTASGKPYKLTPFFSCSPGLKEETVRSILSGLRCVEL